ncbi:hypothetical protein EOM86_06405 [Candidatus Nomurabacteria bacterium]|nr:hypothetical protein [Candidatus Nomurabacteria bacterium]
MDSVAEQALIKYIGALRQELAVLLDEVNKPKNMGSHILEDELDEDGFNMILSFAEAISNVMKFRLEHDKNLADTIRDEFIKKVDKLDSTISTGKTLY